MKKVYIAGKLNARSSCNYIKNVHRMIKAGDKIRKLGYSVYIPCLDLLLGLVAGNMAYEDYFDNNLPWIKVSDFLYVLPNSDDSSGTQREIDFARINNIPIITNINQFKEEIK